MLALSAARDLPMMLVYAAGIGIGYGLTFFASTILLLDYFGRGPNLELFATVNLISTVGAVAPTFAGFVADQTGSFAPAFIDPGGAGGAGAAGGRCMMRRPHAEARHERREFGVFLPVANGGWIVSRNTPLLDGGWAQNRDAALIAEEEGFDFVMSMGKWRGFGGDTDHWGASLEAVTMMAGIAASPSGSRSGRPCTPSCTIRWWRRR